MICNMKPCNITSRSLIIAQLSESKKNYHSDLQCAISCICMYYIIVLSCCLHSGIRTIKRSKEKNAFMLQKDNTVYKFCQSAKYKIFSVFALIFFLLLPESQIQIKISVYSNKFIHNFHLSESSFKCSGFGQVGYTKAVFFKYSCIMQVTNLKCIFKSSCQFIWYRIRYRITER